jgi:hypothetical protein
MWHDFGTAQVQQASATTGGAQDRILRCRINAAFRDQPERRIDAAGGALEEICLAPTTGEFPGSLRGASPGAQSVAASIVSAPFQS